jgi:biofilm PGA synthesis N-glycosyltransferase PgaC
MWLIALLLIFLIIYPYVIYPAILYVLPKNSVAMLKKLPEITNISLFIAAYNEEKVIKEKLNNSLVLETANVNLEIIVASDGSTDATIAIVKEFENKYSNIKLLDFKERQGKVNVINRGLQFCKGEIILLSDANAMYNRECLQKILPHFQNEKCGCVAGEKRVKAMETDISKNEGLYWKLESKIKQLEAKVKTVIGADGACYAIRKKLFCKLPKDTAVDDFLLSMKIVEQGYNIEYEPEAYSYEESGSSLKQELNRKIRIAAGNFYNLCYLKRFFAADIVSFMFISHKLLRWISPALFLALSLVLTVLTLESLTAIILLFLLVITYIGALINYNYNINIFLSDKLSRLITYFYLTVYAQLIGFIKYLSGKQKAVWNTIRE